MSDDVLDAEGDALAADELGAAPARPRALTAAELASSLAAGQRAAWLLEPDLAALYARHIAEAYRLAAKALPRIAKHSPAGGLSAAMDPAERHDRQHRTTVRTARAIREPSRRTPGSGGWSMPDQDELGVALRLRMDEEWEKKQKGQTPEAIRIEAMRRTTAAGLELMHVSFDVRNPLVQGVLAQLGGKITEIEDTTRRDIMRSLDESWQKGDSIPRAAKKLRAVSEQVSLSRGRLIARTEILGAVNGGAHALGMLSDAIGRETGQPALLKIWLTAEDEKVRDSHVEAGDTYANGSGIPMDEPFQIGDSRMQYPGDPDGAAEEVCNCRCALSYEEAGASLSAEPAAEASGPGLSDFLPSIGESAPAEAQAADVVDELGPSTPDIGSPEALAAERARYEAEDAAAAEALRAYDPERAAREHAGLPPHVEAAPDAFGVSVHDSTPAWDATRSARMFHAQAVVDQGLQVEVRSTAATPTKVRVAAKIMEPGMGLREGEAGEVGNLTRTIDLKAGVASHDSFFLDDEWQGKGIATDMLRSAVREYDAAGIKRVEVQAAGTNGRYTWSRFGFDFRPGEADRMRASFRQQFYEYADNLAAGLVPKTGIVEGQTVVLGNDARLRAAFPETMARIDAAEHSWDFANLTVDENGQLLQNIGRDFMLGGPAWYGELDLTAGSPGRRIFDAYTGGKPPLTADANLEGTMSEQLPSVIPDDAQPIEAAGPGRAWTSVLCLEGVPTSDGRMLGIDSVGWRELPLTLLAQLSLEDAHAGAIVAGRIDRIEKMPAEDAVRAGLLCERDGGYPPDAVAVVGYGVFDDSALGDEVQRLVGDEVLRGISVDLAPERGEVLELPPVDGQELGSLMEIMTAGSLMGATVCAHPAFAEASIRIDGADAEQPVVAAMRARTHLHVVTDAAIVLAPLEPARFAAQDHSAGSMIALHPAPAEADAIAQPGGQPAGDLHCTLAFLPDPGAVDFAALHKLVAGVAAEHDPISGKVGGAGYFAPSEPVSAAAPPEVPDAETPADGEDAEPPADAADPPAGAEPHPHVALIDAPGMSKMRANLCAAMDDAGIPYAQNHDFTPHMTLGYEAAPSKPALHVAGQPVSFGAISVHEGPARTDHPMGAPAMTASAAGMAPEQPPSEWFENPELDGPTPITITDEGRIYGHLATWGTCHVGRPGECVEPPESLTDYALFHLGHVLTSDNELVPVGTLTLDTGHAGLTLGTTATQAHYDDTGTAAADVRCGEDDHGIWFAGAIRPDLDSRSVRALRAAKISGDWRPHNGTREMVAALAVNVPGFPVVRPRTAVAASGQLLGLVAAGVDLAPAAVPTRTRILELAERANPGTLAMRREALALRARNAIIEQR